MPEQLQTRGPVQIREYVPTPSAQGGADREIIDRVRVLERGPDIVVESYYRGLRIGQVTIPREKEREFVGRLFGEIEEIRTDRQEFEKILQQFEDACITREPQQLVAAWRTAMAAYDTMARDLSTLAALPSTERGAA